MCGTLSSIDDMVLGKMKGDLNLISPGGIGWYKRLHKSDTIMPLNGDEHTWLLPSEIALITLVYPSFKLIRAPAIIITLFRPLLLCCNCLFETKNYQSMFNWHFVIMTRIASGNHFAHKLTLYQHSLSFLEASGFNCSIFPQFLQGESSSVS